MIDDRAECYDGRQHDLGAADVALYSFGLIKTATAAGGAVLLVADPESAVADAGRTGRPAAAVRPRVRG